VARNNLREVLASATWWVKGFEEPATSEACAIYKAMEWANKCCFLSIIIE